MDTILSTSDTHSKQGSEGGDVSVFVSALQKILPVGAVILSKEGQRPFECDGLTIYQQLPLVTAMPETVDQVQAILRLCHLHRVPLVPRGAGTGLCAWRNAPC